MVLSQKTLTGGGNNDAGTPSFANAPISRFIAYKNCCPSSSTCESNYLINFIQKTVPEHSPVPEHPPDGSPLTPGTSSITYSSIAPELPNPPLGNRLNKRPCNNDLLYIGFFEKGSAMIALHSYSVMIFTKLEANKFSKIKVTGESLNGPYLLDVSTATFPGIPTLFVGGSVYRMYWWNNYSPNFPNPPLPPPTTNFPTEGGIYNIEFS